MLSTRPQTFCPLNNTYCLEAWVEGGEVKVRESLDPYGPRLSVQPHKWVRFLDAVCSSEVPLPPECGLILETASNGNMVLQNGRTRVQFSETFEQFRSRAREFYPASLECEPA